jgi:hypothetical protein
MKKETLIKKREELCAKYDALVAIGTAQKALDKMNFKIFKLTDQIRNKVVA